MSTSYHLHINVCPCCKRVESVIPLGTRYYMGAGKTAFETHPDSPDLVEVKRMIESEKSEIRDEYDNEISLYKFTSIKQNLPP